MDRGSAPPGSGAIRGVEGRSSASSNVRPTSQERPLMDFSTPGAVKTGYTALRTELERSLDMLSDSLFRPGGVANRRRTVQFAAPLGSPPAVPVHTRDPQVGSGGYTPEGLAEERRKMSQASAQKRGIGRLLNTSDAADYLPCVDFGGCRIILKQTKPPLLLYTFIASYYPLLTSSNTTLGPPSIVILSLVVSTCILTSSLKNFFISLLSK